MAEMSSKSRSWYEREVDALRDRVNALTLASDSETAMAMDLIIVAALVGADAVRLAEKTDVPIDKIRPLERRLREAQIWNGRSVDAREWCDMDYFDRILVIFLQAKVALGVVKRAQLDGYAAFLCTKHPAALGRPASEVWPEIWHQVGPRVELRCIGTRALTTTRCSLPRTARDIRRERTSLFPVRGTSANLDRGLRESV